MDLKAGKWKMEMGNGRGQRGMPGEKQSEGKMKHGRDKFVNTRVTR